MNILPEQNELILKLKEAYKEKGLTLNGLIDMMPEDSMKLGRSTVQRLFHGKESEHKNYDYNTLIMLSNLLLDVDEEGFFCTTKEFYGTQPFDPNGTGKFDIEDENNIAYWLNNDGS